MDAALYPAWPDNNATDLICAASTISGVNAAGFSIDR